MKNIRTGNLTILALAIGLLSSLTLKLSASTGDNTYDKQYKSARESFLKFTPQGFDKSIELYTDIISKDPNYAKAYSGLSEVYSYIGNYKFHIKEDYESYFNDSNKYLKKALKLAPHTLETKRALATSYLHLRWMTRAKKEANSIIGQYPGSAEAYFILWASTGRIPKNPNIAKALELNPNFVPAHIALGTAYFYRNRNYKKAAEHYNKSLEIADSPELRDYLGTTLRTQGRLSKALEQYEKAIKMDGSFAMAYMNRGITKYYMRKYEDAISDLNKAVSINIHHPETFFYLASSHEHTNNKELALKNYRQFFNLALNDHKYDYYINKAKASYNKLSN